MDYRILQREEIERLKEIDRSEIVEGIYYSKNGKLELVKEFYAIKSWPEGQGQVEKMINRLYDLYDRGGTVFGAFDNITIAGMAALESKFIGKNKDQLQLALLHVSNKYRKMGIGKKLLDLARNKAKEMGASKLYISASPSKNTVDFYMRVGCVLASEINEELFELEPEDIHMELKLIS